MSDGRRLLSVRWLLSVVFLSLLSLSPSSWAGQEAGRPGAASFDHGYSVWESLLRSVVSGDRVNYGALRSDRRLGQFLESVASVDPESLAGWSRTRQVAFYINTYNALTFQTVLDAMPIDSIRDIKPDPFEQRRWTVAGRAMSLNEIEHKKLRGDMADPRIHFVLVCAARSCPSLSSRAFVASSLEEQLERAGRNFFTDATKNRVDRGTGQLYLNRLLDWYGSDFVGWSGLVSFGQPTGREAQEDAVIRAMARYVGASDREFLESGSFTVVYNEYDWSLNGRQSR
ncbi:MAG: DUF547 domain-containing protein [Myxococcota bacterium]|nr:DUF547 domain-containing protein [Myxococcota bacterium]